MCSSFGSRARRVIDESFRFIDGLTSTDANDATPKTASIYAGRHSGDDADEDEDEDENEEDNEEENEGENEDGTTVERDDNG